MTKQRKSIIVDIDGTLADCSHRLHHIEDMTDEEATFEVDWDAFYADCGLDTPIVPTCRLVRDLADADWCIILITGRSGRYREQTEAWLDRYDLPFDLLLMRKHGDHTDDSAIKRAWYRQLKNREIVPPSAEVPELVIEDRKRVVEMWREEGLIALQCAKGDF